MRVSDDQRLAEIRARVEAATRGPWWRSETLSQGNYIMGLYPGGVEETWVATVNEVPPGPDTAFIAHSRGDISYLLSLLDAERAEREDSEQEWLESTADLLGSRQTWQEEAIALRAAHDEWLNQFDALMDDTYDGDEDMESIVLRWARDTKAALDAERERADEAVALARDAIEELTETICSCDLCHTMRTRLAALTTESTDEGSGDLFQTMGLPEVKFPSVRGDDASEPA